MNNKRYWLRGLMIGVVLYIGLWSIFGICSLTLFDRDTCFSAAILISGITWQFITSIFENLGLTYNIGGILFTSIVLVTSFLVYVLPFVFFGWLYGKIRSRGKVI